MEKIITFEPAFDKRSEDPKKNYGIHGVSLRFVLKGDKGAVQFVLYTNWQLPHVQKEHIENCKGATGRYGTYCRMAPMPSDLGFHSPKPLWDGQERHSEEDCQYIGVPCYYDGSGLNADEPYQILLKEGSDGVWKFLEEYYKGLFEK